MLKLDRDYAIRWGRWYMKLWISHDMHDLRRKITWNFRNMSPKEMKRMKVSSVCKNNQSICFPLQEILIDKCINIHFSTDNTVLYIYNRQNNLSLVCLYLSLYIFFLSFGHFLFFFLFFFLTHRDRKHYDIKVVESIQFVCAGNYRISRVLWNANNYRSIHEG